MLKAHYQRENLLQHKHTQTENKKKKKKNFEHLKCIIVTNKLQYQTEKKNRNIRITQHCRQ